VDKNWARHSAVCISTESLTVRCLQTAFIVEHDFIMAAYLADRVVVYDGVPSSEATAHCPQSLLTGDLTASPSCTCQSRSLGSNSLSYMVDLYTQNGNTSAAQCKGTMLQAWCDFRLTAALLRCMCCILALDVTVYSTYCNIQCQSAHHAAGG
jgi:hypothetical protein